jgi:hypothetical protein
MMKLFTLFLPLCIGAGCGWGLRQRTSYLKRFVFAGVVLICVPVLLVLISNVLKSEALGWIGGLSLMVMILSTPLFAVGAMIGWLISSRHVPSEKSTVANEQNVQVPKSRPISARTISVRSASALPVPARKSKQFALLITIAGVASAFWILVAFGFRLNSQRVPAELDAGIGPAVFVLLTALAFGVRFAWLNRGRVIHRPNLFRRNRHPASKEIAKYTKWRVAMANDPRRQRYAALLDAGDVFWTPKRVEYDLNSQATTCCMHLVAIELAMREGGLRAA